MSFFLVLLALFTLSKVIKTHVILFLKFKDDMNQFWQTHKDYLAIIIFICTLRNFCLSIFFMKQLPCRNISLGRLKILLFSSFWRKYLTLCPENNFKEIQTFLYIWRTHMDKMQQQPIVNNINRNNLIVHFQQITKCVKRIKLPHKSPLTC